MEIETLFTDQKWNILKNLSMNKFSPLQLANLSNTTIANISQQLRLLEAAELVQKEKIPNREKGKPRTLFSLKDDYAYLISAMEDFAEKRLLRLTDYHKTILKIWYLEDPELHYHLEKFYWKIEPLLNKIKGIAIIKNEVTRILIVSDSLKKSREKIDDIHVNKDKIIEVKIFTEKEFSKITSNIKAFNLLILYDPNLILANIKNRLNGGDVKRS